MINKKINQDILYIKGKKKINKKNLISKEFYAYKALIGNKLRFTNSESYEYLSGLNFNNNVIFNFTKALALLRRSLNFMKQIKKNKGNILFVGTRHDLRKIVEKIGLKTNSPYINYRWVKGLLSNWENTSNSIKFYHLFLKKLDMKSKRKLKMKNSFLGLSSMTKLPQAIFIVDINNDLDALTEAKALNIPVIAIVDSNTSLKNIDYPIPGNNESLISIIFFINLIISSLRK
jgi:small subunit ribosomal protein S2